MSEPSRPPPASGSAPPSGSVPKRGPRVFEADDPTLAREPPPIEPPPAGSEPPRAAGIVRPTRAGVERGWRWGALLLAAATALFSLAATLWFARFVSITLARQDWIGWLAVTLAGLMALAAVAMLLRELGGLWRLRRMGQVRKSADTALAGGDKRAAITAVRGLKALLAGRRELDWGRQRLAQHEGDVLDAKELLRLADRELVVPLDRDARRAIVASAKRVATVTAISPWALLAAGFVLYESLRLLRRIAALYGGRPGFVGGLRLGRMVVGHMILTGGVALTDDLLHQFLGQDLVRRLSRRLGEGVFNGTLTARVGVVAMTVCRPLPFVETPPPRLRDVVKEVFRRDGAAVGTAETDATHQGAAPGDRRP